MIRHVKRTAGPEHQRWIAEIALEQEGSERPLLGHQAVAGRVRRREAGACEQTRFADLRADDHPHAAGSCVIDDTLRADEPAHLGHADVDDPLRGRFVEERANDVMNAETLPKVRMPNRDGFIVRFPDKMP